MENHISWLAQFVNHLFGRFALAILSALHIKPNNPEAPIPEHVVMALCVLLLGTVLALLLRSRLSVERPGGMQQVAELLLTNPMGFVSNSSATCCMPPGRSTESLERSRRARTVPSSKTQRAMTTCSGIGASGLLGLMCSAERMARAKRPKRWFTNCASQLMWFSIR